MARQSSLGRSHIDLGGIAGVVTPARDSRDDRNGAPAVRGVILNHHRRASLFDLRPYGWVKIYEVHLPAANTSYPGDFRHASSSILNHSFAIERSRSAFRIAPSFTR